MGIQLMLGPHWPALAHHWHNTIILPGKTNDGALEFSAFIPVSPYVSNSAKSGINMEDTEQDADGKQRGILPDGAMAISIFVIMHLTPL